MVQLKTTATPAAAPVKKVVIAEELASADAEMHSEMIKSEKYANRVQHQNTIY